MLATDMIEARNNRITIDDFDAAVVEQMIVFIETSTVFFTSDAPLIDLLLIADKYDITGLLSLVAVELIEGLSVETVCETYAYALLIYGVDNLQAACARFFSSHRDAICSHSSWRALSFDSCLSILNL